MLYGFSLGCAERLYSSYLFKSGCGYCSLDRITQVSDLGSLFITLCQGYILSNIVFYLIF